MKCNRKIIKGDKFVWDGCHKIYVLQTPEEVQEASNDGFKIYPIENLPEIYNRSCPLRFISYWDVSKPYICPQGVKASFKE